MKIDCENLIKVTNERLVKGNDLILYIDGIEVTATFSDKWEHDTYNRVREILLSDYDGKKMENKM